MSQTVIRVEGVSKQYRLGQVSTGTISHDVNRWWHRLRGKEDPYLKIGEKNDRTIKGTSDYVWALKDISFDVKHGEVLGIIGRNGAGKSTLLKILSRTTAPTTGKVKIKGRVASLLEVGTGFHPELSGRDNIYLNGAILGMTKQEITKKFDEIVDFAGVERYLDTPVKRYSSGMYVRLAFAVAAHLEPEILIVDEVLAVGDEEFQKKALGKMKDVSNTDGRTVLFVSHNMGAMKSLCSSGLLLENGLVNFQKDNIDHIVSSYYKTTTDIGMTMSVGDRKDRDGNGSIILNSFNLLDNLSNSKAELGRQISFSLSYKSILDRGEMKILLSINNLRGDCILFLDSSTIHNFSSRLNKTGRIEIYLSPEFGLPIGEYYINIAVLLDGITADYIQNVLRFEVVDGLFFKNGKIPVGKSLCFVKQEWIHKENIEK